MTSSSSPPPIAIVLGIGGLIPLLGLALIVWFDPLGYRPAATAALVGYGASIFSFLGAIYWGLGMRDASPAGPSIWVWGVVPSLIAWVALLLAPTAGLGLITAGLVACLIVDSQVYQRHQLAAWLPLRRVLTGVASVCCLAAAWGATQ